MAPGLPRRRARHALACQQAIRALGPPQMTALAAMRTCARARRARARPLAVSVAVFVTRREDAEPLTSTRTWNVREWPERRREIVQHRRLPRPLAPPRSTTWNTEGTRSHTRTSWAGPRVARAV